MSDPQIFFSAIGLSILVHILGLLIWPSTPSTIPTGQIKYFCRQSASLDNAHVHSPGGHSSGIINESEYIIDLYQNCVDEVTNKKDTPEWKQ